ncbi:MAG: hypothetical protein NC248_10935 [Bacteroides sp.]|nr:hypothetical protein [Bacteroides sp.]MCM1390986.1 hypothetical protein [Bacteroides sp.]
MLTLIAHRFNRYIVSVLFICAMFLSTGCSSGSGYADGRAVYYWRTTLKLSEEERRFIADNDIDVVYLHLFDVRDIDGELMPTSTLSFRDTIPDSVRVIPVIFIEPGALNGSAPVDSLASRIISRCDKMLTQNGYPLPDEVQIDFDWTLSNRKKYYGVLENAADIMHSRGGVLSTTIRLHQLAQTPPPVDRGVLMVYNTGNITDFSTTNSILDCNSVKPYIGMLRSYRLPLSTALPIYSWDVVFSGGEFKAISRSLEVTDTAMFVPENDGRYRCIKYGPLAMAGSRDGLGGRIYPGDVVRHEFVSPATLATVFSEIKSARPDAVRNIVLYHLDEKSILQYEPEFLEKLTDGSVGDWYSGVVGR